MAALAAHLSHQAHAPSPLRATLFASYGNFFMHSHLAQRCAAAGPPTASDAEPAAIEAAAIEGADSETRLMLELTCARSAFRDWLRQLIVDDDFQAELERCGAINHSDGASALSVFRCDGDGGCLPHSLHIAIVGMHDRQLSLRRLLHQMMLSARHRAYLLGCLSAAQACEAQRISAADAQRTPPTDSAPRLSALDVQRDLEHEYNRLVAACADQSVYLESLHVFVLCNLLRRPILVYGNPLSHRQDNVMQGIYLPLMVADVDHRRSDCAVGGGCWLILCPNAFSRVPLAIAYRAGTHGPRTLRAAALHRRIAAVASAAAAAISACRRGRGRRQRCARLHSATAV